MSTLSFNSVSAYGSALPSIQLELDELTMSVWKLYDQASSESSDALPLRLALNALSSRFAAIKAQSHDVICMSRFLCLKALYACLQDTITRAAKRQMKDLPPASVIPPSPLAVPYLQASDYPNLERMRMALASNPSTPLYFPTPISAASTPAASSYPVEPSSLPNNPNPASRHLNQRPAIDPQRARFLRKNRFDPLSSRITADPGTEAAPQEVKKAVKTPPMIQTVGSWRIVTLLENCRRKPAKTTSKSVLRPVSVKKASRKQPPQFSAIVTHRLQVLNRCIRNLFSHTNYDRDHTYIAKSACITLRLEEISQELRNLHRENPALAKQIVADIQKALQTCFRNEITATDKLIFGIGMQALAKKLTLLHEESYMRECQLYRALTATIKVYLPF